MVTGIKERIRNFLKEKRGINRVEIIEYEKDAKMMIERSGDIGNIKDRIFGKEKRVEKTKK